MRSSTVIMPLLAALAVASPITKRQGAGQNNSASQFYNWLCKNVPQMCNGSHGTITSDSSAYGVQQGTNTGSGQQQQPGYGSSSGSSSSGSNTSGSSSTGSSSSSSGSADGNDWASLHNDYRQKHKDTGDLVWDDDLASGAKDHSAKCVFEHSQGGDYGENLAMGVGLTNQQTVDMWYDEIKDFDSYWGKNDVPMSVMHFTQVVWKQTTKVGCGVADCGSQGKLATCRYSLPGNVLGDFAANVAELK